MKKCVKNLAVTTTCLSLTGLILLKLKKDSIENAKSNKEFIKKQNEVKIATDSVEKNINSKNENDTLSWKDERVLKKRKYHTISERKLA